jgi:hypothetical protein
MPGRVISHAKTQAAKVNGAKSGRPRKTSVEAARIYLASDPDCFCLLCGSDALVAMKPCRPLPIAPGAGLPQNAGHPLHGQKRGISL